MHGENTNTHKTLIRKPEGRRPLVRHILRWENNIKMCINEIQVRMWNGSSSSNNK